MSNGRFRLVLAMALLVVVAACEVHNKNSVTCHDDDCQAACESQGYSGGACADGDCVCNEPDAGPYDWDGGGDTDSDTDTDTDSDQDAGDGGS